MSTAVETASQAVFWKYQRARPCCSHHVPPHAQATHHAGGEVGARGEGGEEESAGASGGGPGCVVAKVNVGMDVDVDVEVDMVTKIWGWEKGGREG